MSKNCPYCGSIRVVPAPSGNVSICLACESFLAAVTSVSKQTVFERITQSEERLAETYMFNHDGKVFKSLLLPHMVFNSREEAHAATVARLKEVAK